MKKILSFFCLSGHVCSVSYHVYSVSYVYSVSCRICSVKFVVSCLVQFLVSLVLLVLYMLFLSLLALLSCLLLSHSFSIPYQSHSQDSQLTGKPSASGSGGLSEGGGQSSESEDEEESVSDDTVNSLGDMFLSFVVLFFV